MQRFPDFDTTTAKLINEVLPFTMTSPERLFALSEAVHYVVKSGIPGDIVECGLWKGGSMMLVAKTLMSLRSERQLWAYDTFTGMPPPDKADRDLQGRDAEKLLQSFTPEAELIRCKSSLAEVQSNLESTGFKKELITYIAGQVETTLPKHAPRQIAILRLDTDWYQSTLHELVHLYPLLSPGGILIIDDYGHWQGARKAVDEFFSANEAPIFLNRIDYTGRLVVKPFLA